MSTPRKAQKHLAIILNVPETTTKANSIECISMAIANLMFSESAQKELFLGQ